MPEPRTPLASFGRVKARHRFTVRPHLPAPLVPLDRLARNLRWSWDRPTRALFERVDPRAWAAYGDPLVVLQVAAPERLDAVAADPAFLADLAAVEADLDAYLGAPRWFQHRGESFRIGYFSPEFGISETLPQYSGGLGVLAGDHLKAASDLGVDIVGVGLFYTHGYFRQSLSVDGWQQERYPTLDPHAMALTLVRTGDDGAPPLHVTVDVGGRPVTLQVWRADVGRVPLYLLDANLEENDPDLRTITDRLYGGDTEHRLRQEIVLGVGGVRALRAVAEPVDVFHTNEGHAGFLGLERIRELVCGEGLSFDEAVAVTRAGGLFTTHTPVPAGIDRFPVELMERYFGSWCTTCGVPFEDLLALGRRPDEADDRFNMAVMGLRLAGASNGVSQLHGDVSRHMFAGLWPQVATHEVPIGSVTNGVHGPSWVSAEVDDLLRAEVAPDWSVAPAPAWDGILDVDPARVWATRRQGTERLVRFVRGRLRQAALAAGASPAEVAWTDDALDPDALTICFARRFATYKRATLLLSQPERLRRLLLEAPVPVQFVFAGKAHPADDEGKELIRRIVAFSHDLGVRHRFAFVDDYDIGVARMLYQGADVWLNTPRRPLEACGTSGEKAALNGALNCSVLDGWWAELYDGDNGWAVTSAPDVDDLVRRDAIEAESLFGLLEQQIVPLFADRDTAGLPRGWIDRMLRAWRSLGPQVTAQRMVRDYVERWYEPLARRSIALGRTGHAEARELVAWRHRVEHAWPTVRVELGEHPAEQLEGSASVTVDAAVTLAELDPTDVAVEVVHGRISPDGTIELPIVVEAEPVGVPDGGVQHYRASFRPGAAGHYGCTVRVLPRHPELDRHALPGLIVWA